MLLQKRSIPDAIRGLTIERLTQQIDSFQNGCLSDFALTADAMENRDDILKNVITKRKKAVTRHGWEILTENDSLEARQQREALDYFYRHLTCSHALRQDEHGGFQLLAYQMMDAVAKGYAVHEIIWKPIITANDEVRSAKSNSNGGARPCREATHHDLQFRLRPSFSPRNTRARAWKMLPLTQQLQNLRLGQHPRHESHLSSEHFETPSESLWNTTSIPIANSNSSRRRGHESQIELHSNISPRTYLFSAHFKFVPLWYFEATSGRLRFLSTPGATAGEPIKERDWLVTVGDALMVACSRAFLYKHQPLQAWLDYTRQFGFPGIRGITAAARGTPEFEAMRETLGTFMKDLSVVTNSSESIDVVDLKGHGQPPFADLVERMDRVMAALWRGADLSTISRDRGYGASLQAEESDLLEQDDARTLSEHLNTTVDRWIIEMLFGKNVERLARIKILVTPEERTPHDLAVDQFLIEHGARLSVTETLERYGRAEADPGDRYLARPEPIAPSTPRTRQRQESHLPHQPSPVLRSFCEGRSGT